MGSDSFYVTSPRMCFSTEDYNEWMNEHYKNNDDGDEKIIPDWFYLPYCDECEKHREFVNNTWSHHWCHWILVTCNFCQNVFTTFSNREIGCPSFCRWIKRKLKACIFEKSKNFANVYSNKKRREDYINYEVVQKIENYGF